MGAAFTPEEQTLIRKDLKKAARKFLAQYGMKKTSIDQIVAEVGISKGAFYKFYESKEHLFFDVMEDIHEEIFLGASKILADAKHLNPIERIEQALLYTIQVFSETSLLTFMTDELPLIVRKLPKKIMEEHAVSDSVNIAALLKAHDIILPCSPEFLSGLVRAIVCLTREKAIIGEACYEEVLQFIVHSACQQAFLSIQ